MIMEGKDKGQTGSVLRVFKHKNRLIVEGRNLCKKNIKRTEGSPGGIITKEAPIHVSNVMVRPLTPPPLPAASSCSRYNCFERERRLSAGARVAGGGPCDRQAHSHRLQVRRGRPEGARTALGWEVTGREAFNRTTQSDATHKLTLSSCGAGVLYICRCGCRWESTRPAPSSRGRSPYARVRGRRRRRRW